MQERWNDNMKVVIVGGVAGGATAAARIRRLNAVSYTHLTLPTIA